MKKIRKHSLRGFGIGGFLLVIPLGIILLLLVVVVFYEARKVYWDSTVQELCEKDGGVRIFERVRVSEADMRVLERNNGRIAVPVKELAHRDAPVYSKSTVSHIRQWNPEVRRVDTVVMRRADKKIVAQWIYYSRIGGDFPTFAHPSSRGCPNLNLVTAELEKLFIVEGDSK